MDQAIDHTGRIGAPVDVVAQEDETISSLERHRLEEFVELLELAMNVTDRVQHDPLDAG